MAAGGFATRPYRYLIRVSANFGERRRFRMDPIYQALKTRTHQIAARYPRPALYRRHCPENDYSDGFFCKNRLLLALKDAVSGPLSENLGHGFDHAVKVAVDAGLLVIIEGRRAGHSRFSIDRLLLLVQSASLLHDICRVEKDHAKKGADKAREYLAGFPFTEAERNDICRAIHNHEAFKDTVASPTQTGRLISDCLYDADKFRWGTDNFSFTVWDMLHFSKVPVSDFVAHYSKGIDTLVKIRGTFRTRTGKEYGPRFIDIGLAIGRELYSVMETEFHLL